MSLKETRRTYFFKFCQEKVADSVKNIRFFLFPVRFGRYGAFFVGDNHILFPDSP